MPTSAANLSSGTPAIITIKTVFLGNPNFTEPYGSSPDYADSNDTIFHIIAESPASSHASAAA